MAAKDKADVFDLNDQVRALREHRPLDSSGGPPDDPRMDERVERLEKFADEARTELRAIDVRLTKIDTRLEQMATKADLADAMNGMVKWIVGTAVALGAAALTIMTFVLNNAVPKVPVQPAAQPAPIVITVPAAALAPAAPQQEPAAKR